MRLYLATLLTAGACSSEATGPFEIHGTVVDAGRPSAPVEIGLFERRASDRPADLVASWLPSIATTLPVADFPIPFVLTGVPDGEFTVLARIVDGPEDPEVVFGYRFVTVHPSGAILDELGEVAEEIAVPMLGVAVGSSN
jgi:hypothetical protein